MTSSRGLRLRQRPILAQAPQDVLDADDGIVDQHAERHRESAERHGVEGETHVVEHAPPPRAATAGWR